MKNVIFLCNESIIWVKGVEKEGHRLQQCTDSVQIFTDIVFFCFLMALRNSCSVEVPAVITASSSHSIVE